MEQQFDFEVLVKLQQKKRRKSWKRILSGMICLVVFCTTYMLILPAITKETRIFCGKEEHAHNEECYQEQLICEQEEHSHSLACFADPSADLEEASDWEKTLPELTGVYAQDILAIARSQLGYTESSLNYIVDGEGGLKGYTRYGAWYGDPYIDWNAAFVSFCLSYAGVDKAFLDDYCPDWVNTLKDEELYQIPSEYIPKVGDAIFFDWEDDGKVDHVGLVAEVVGTDVVTIEGDVENSVAQNTYELHDNRIDGYATTRLALKKEPGQSVTEDTGAMADLVLSNGLTEEEDQTQEQEEEKGKSGGIVRFATTRLYSLLRNSTRAGTPLDLAPFINSVTMYDEAGNVIPSGSLVTEGDMIEFKIDFTLTGQQLGIKNEDQTITVYTDTLSYDLPNVFEIIRGEKGDILNSAGQTVGTYTIDNENGKIIMTFSEQYVNQNISGMQIHGHISFFSTVVKITDEESENQDYPFKDGLTLGVVVEEKTEVVGDLTIEKKKISVNGEEIIYEIRVTSAEGTTGSITVTDNMSEGLSFKNGISVQKGSGGTVSNASFVPAADRRSFTLTLPEMKAGDSYIVRYSCTADIDLLGADMTVRNTASVTGKDSHDNPLKDKVTVDHTFDMLKKTGEANDDGTITWTITVNQAKADISGWILQDIITTKTGEVAYTGTVTIRNSSGNVVAQNARLPYTFPAGSKDTYTITYTTSHDYDDGATISNKAILKDDNTEVNVVTGVGVGDPITKQGTAGEVIQIDGKNLLPVTWTVTIDTSIGEIPADEILKDVMEDWTSNEMYMTYEQLMAAYANIKAALEAAGSSVSEFEAKEYKAGMGQNTDRKYNYSQLTGNVNGTHSKLYEYFEVTLGKAIAKGKVVTFSYEAYGVFENNVVAGAVYINQFQISQQYLVKATVQFTAGAVKVKKLALSYYDPAVHGEDFWHWNLYHYNGTDGVTALDYEQLRDDYLAWAIELSTPLEYLGKGNIVIHEDLPEGVTVKRISLPFNSNIPTAPLDLQDIELGKTYEWKFLLYTPEQYLRYNFRDGQEVTITINVSEEGDLEIIIPGIVFETMAQYAVLYNTQVPEANKMDEWYGYLHIFTQINDDVEWIPRSAGSTVYVNNFENRFTLKNENGDVLDIASQTQRITKDETTGVIRKEATDKNNVITYSVVLNAYGRDLIENSDALSIHDELTYQSTDAKPLRVRLVPGSVKLYEIDLASDGSYEKINELTPSYSYNEVSSQQGATTTWKNTIDLPVPDSTSLLLEYKYNVTGVKDVKYDILNVCTIQGVGQGGLDGDHKMEIEVKQTSAQADTAGVMLYKVDAYSDGVFLENARFNIYIWNEDKGEYIIVHHADGSGTEFVTDANGMIILDGSTIAENQFAYNTAYYIVEVESPEGYYLSPEPYYFQIVNSDLTRYPSCLPAGFTGQDLTSGDIIYRKNVSDTTEISIEKRWKSYSGADMTVTVEKIPSITVELWQMLKGDPGSAKLYETYTLIPDENGNWSLTITDLPKATKNSDGTKGTDYLYYIKEVGVGGFELESAENNNGINSGTIKLVNRELEGYKLPETGGAGTRLYTTAGLLLILISIASLLYMRKKRRREDYSSS